MRHKASERTEVSSVRRRREATPRLAGLLRRPDAEPTLDRALGRSVSLCVL
jgi:hypothetical protein